MEPESERSQKVFLKRFFSRMIIWGVPISTRATLIALVKSALLPLDWWCSFQWPLFWYTIPLRIHMTPFSMRVNGEFGWLALVSWDLFWLIQVIGGRVLLFIPVNLLCALIFASLPFFGLLWCLQFLNIGMKSSIRLVVQSSCFKCVLITLLQ